MEQFLELPPQIIKQLTNDKVRNFELLKKIDLQIKSNPNAKILFFGFPMFGTGSCHSVSSWDHNRLRGLLVDF